MTPHRAPALVDHASGIVRQVFAAPEPSAGVLAGILAILAAFWNIHVVLLLILVIAGGVVDLWTGSRRARIRTRLGLPGGFDRTVLDEGASGKGAVLAALIFLGISIDSVIALIGNSAELGIGNLFQSLTPATAALLAYRLAREWGSITENIEGTPGGKDAIWPGVRKFVDVLRFRLSHPGTGMPHQRWDDDLTAEERAWVEQQLGERRGDQK